MKKNVWIWNHYATNMLENKGGRHYWFAKYLMKMGYSVTIFCASTRHINEKNIETGKEKYKINSENEIPFVFVKTTAYKDNGVDRVKNMFSFYRNLFPTAKDYAQKNGKPDVILASSVHPLTLVAGIKIAKKFGVPCICEVRDLWPESLVAYGALKRNSLFTKLLFFGEKWIYKKADKLIFTIEGGKDYITDRGWDKDRNGPVDLEKVHHINNGVSLETYSFNKENYAINDSDLENQNSFKVIYTGSVRKVNNVGLILEIAENLKGQNVEFLIYGDGDHLRELIMRVELKGLSNVKFKGRIEKKSIPYVLSKANLNIILGQSNPVFKYGISPNKLFEYLASGRPILSTFKPEYSLIERFNTGKELETNDSLLICKEILEFKNMHQDEYQEICNNAKQTSELFDYKVLTKKLSKVF
ncbi:glycosyltransferase family 4 protein [Planococcus salinarum]|uniref:glycosyltransferase family 4 protein n=1 Tax=Planococcus salinarum TaxID=622695 RepID=UPI000E3D46EB|nr:glycosyltransferase family 4 protein [Planococcus salinarum]TAA72862.1 glycosyltransferase WbuB [Planococcus salinarum]